MNQNSYGFNLLTLQDGERFLDVRKAATWEVSTGMDGRFDIVALPRLTSPVTDGKICATYTSRETARYAIRSLNTALVDCSAHSFVWPPDNDDNDSWTRGDCGTSLKGVPL